MNLKLDGFEMKKSILVLIICAVAITDSTFANLTGTINQLSVGRNGDEILIDLDTNANNACPGTHASGFDYALSIEEHPASAEIMNVLLLAYSPDQRITVIGQNSCNIEPRLGGVGYVILSK